ncbi:SDR family NAD(P)-dependent oxidoreductase [Streptomyces cyaneofuscatus]|nr:SDR family NAD(P)-dependent oxidoreductase [Streptomyces cyaneofuscatus]
MSAYHAAKWAVGGFSESLAAEVAPLGIKVTVLEPGGACGRNGPGRP